MDDSAGQPSHHPQPDLATRVADLERRIARLESAAADHNPPAAASPSTTTPPSGSPIVQPPPIRLTPDPAPPRPVFSVLPPNPAPALAAAPPTGHPARPRVAARVVKPRRPSVSLEQLIGGKSFLVLGALIVVAGVGFFLKLAYDQGWIGAVPPGMRCAGAGVFGLVLIGAGLASERRLGRFAGVGFVAAGLGVLYATAFATYAVFGLAGPAAAFGMLAGVSALGLALSVRGGSLLLAVLSLVGAYLVPFILARPDSPAWTLPPYLLALLVVGSGLAVRGRMYRPLATIVWWATGVMGGLWVGGNGYQAPLLGLGFVAVVWATVHAVRLRLPEAETARDRWVAATTSFSTSLWAFAAAWHLAAELGLDRMWIVPAAAASVTATGGLALAGMLDAFRERPRTAGESVGVSLLCQAGAFVPITIAVGIDTAWSQILVWLLLGLGAAAAGRWARAASLAWYGAAILTIGTLRVLSEVTGPLASGEVSGLGLVFTWWMGLMAAACVSWGVCAWLVGRVGRADHARTPWGLRNLQIASGVTAGALLAALVWHEDARAEGPLLAYLVFAAAGLALATARAASRDWLSQAACAFLALAGLVWVSTFLTEDWYMNRPASPPLAYPGLLWSLPIMALWAGSGLVIARSRHAGWRECRLAAWPIGLLIGLGATTMETARIAGSLTTDATLRDGSVSIWWAIVGTGLLAAGFAKRAAWLRYGGIGLLLLATGKLLTWDMAQVSPAVRVACFIAVGLVLLGVAAWYLRSAKAAEVGTAE
jgi:hypothetical protein